MPRPAEFELRAEEQATFLPVEHESEGRFLRLRRQIGLVLAPTLFLVVLAIPMPALAPPAHRLAGVIAAVIVLWITEACLLYTSPSPRDS